MRYLILALSLLISGNSFANTNDTQYVLYYQASKGAMWTKGGTYYDFNGCMNAAKYSYTWAYDTRCNAEN